MQPTVYHDANVRIWVGSNVGYDLETLWDQYGALARAAGVARSIVAVALGRLEAAGLIARTRRQAGAVRFTNAYSFTISETAWSESRPQTTTKPLEQPRSVNMGPRAGDASNADDRVRTLLGALEQRERHPGLVP